MKYETHSPQKMKTCMMWMSAGGRPVEEGGIKLQRGEKECSNMDYTLDNVCLTPLPRPPGNTYQDRNILNGTLRF